MYGVCMWNKIEEKEHYSAVKQSPSSSFPKNLLPDNRYKKAKQYDRKTANAKKTSRVKGNCSRAEIHVHSYSFTSS